MTAKNDNSAFTVSFSDYIAHISGLHSFRQILETVEIVPDEIPWDDWMYPKLEKALLQQFRFRLRKVTPVDLISELLVLLKN